MVAVEPRWPHTVHCALSGSQEVCTLLMRAGASLLRGGGAGASHARALPEMPSRMSVGGREVVAAAQAVGLSSLSRAAPPWCVSRSIDVRRNSGHRMQGAPSASPGKTSPEHVCAEAAPMSPRKERRAWHGSNILGPSCCPWQSSGGCTRCQAPGPPLWPQLLFCAEATPRPILGFPPNPPRKPSAGSLLGV